MAGEPPNPNPNPEPEAAWREASGQGSPLFPSPGGSPLFEGPDASTAYETATCKPDREQAAERIALDGALDDAAKIDALAELRNWFRGDTEVVDDYLAGNLDVAAAVERLAAPVDEMYATADRGRAVRRERGEELEQRGPEQDLPPPDPEPLPSTEAQLWELYYGIIHAARRIPWTNAQQHDKLVQLVAALKSRPDPPPPSPFPPALRRNWIWQTGTLWSGLLLLGASAGEAWNDAPGCAAGWTAPERRAWLAFNAFFARLVAAGAAPGFAIDGVYALESALEEEPPRKGERRCHVEPPSWEVQLGLRVAVAAVWVRIAGERMWCLRRDGKVRPDVRVDVNARGKKLPWSRNKKGVEGDVYCTARWDFWKRRFEQEAQNEDLDEEARGLAREAAGIIGGYFEGLEGGAAAS